MNRKPNTSIPLTFAPVTPERWKDFESLFGPKGACAGCWCMYWRQTSKEFDKNKGATNKRRMKKLVSSGSVPGILALANDGHPVAWCSVAPREEFSRLERARTLKRIDDQPVWSIVCLFVAKEYRGQGVSVAIIEAAADYAASQGAKIVEAYPYAPDKRWADAFIWTGTASAYRRAGFREVARPSEKRRIMRKRV